MLSTIKDISFNTTETKITEELKNFFIFLVKLKEENLIDDITFQHLKKGLKNPETLEYLITETLLLTIGNMYWLTNSSISGALSLQMGTGKAFVLYTVGQAFRGLLLYLAMLNTGKHLTDKEEIAVMSIIPFLGDIFPLIKLGMRNGVQLPGYFHFYRKNKKKFENKSQDTGYCLTEILGDSLGKRQKKMETFDKNLTRFQNFQNDIINGMKPITIPIAKHIVSVQESIQKRIGNLFSQGK